MLKSVRLTRLLILIICVVFIASAFAQPAQAAPSNVPTGSRLRTLAGSFLIGYASRDGFNTMSDAAAYQEVARTEFNFVTPENAMKWDQTESSQGNFNFSNANTLVTFAQANNMKIHGHTLVWHSQLPGWVNSACTSATVCTNIMYSHIDNVMNHWTDGQIAVWDVVNEAFNDDGTRRSSVFQNVIGNNFIELAFRRARAADPLTKLVYNDYNVETVNSKSTAMYNMVSDFKSRGVPIDGVGLQMHMTGAFDYNSLAQNMARFAALGVEVYITEMDVRYPTPISSANLTAQGDVYKNVTQRCRAQSMCKALQVWGIPDKYSWVPDVFPGTGAPLLFDDNYNAKPAYYGVQAGLGGSPVPTNTPVTPTRVPTTAVPTRVPTTAVPTRVPTTAIPTRVGTTVPTRVPTTAVPTRINTPLPDPTPISGVTCSPATTITAPFSIDTAGTFCWRINNIPNYTNNWNLNSLTINGVNFTGMYATPSQLPPKAADGYWYVLYNSSVAWGHFEAK